MKTRQLLLVPDLLWRIRNGNAQSRHQIGNDLCYMGVPGGLAQWRHLWDHLCVLDAKPNEYSELYRKLLFQCARAAAGGFEVIAKSQC